jgi:hypothetical protein
VLKTEMKLTGGEETPKFLFLLKEAGSMFIRVGEMDQRRHGSGGGWNCQGQEIAISN